MTLIKSDTALNSACLVICQLAQWSADALSAKLHFYALPGCFAWMFTCYFWSDSPAGGVVGTKKNPEDLQVFCVIFLFTIIAQLCYFYWQNLLDVYAYKLCQNWIKSWSQEKKHSVLSVVVSFTFIAHKEASALTSVCFIKSHKLLTGAPTSCCCCLG